MDNGLSVLGFLLESNVYFRIQNYSFDLMVTGKEIVYHGTEFKIYVCCKAESLRLESVCRW